MAALRYGDAQNPLPTTPIPQAGSKHPVDRFPEEIALWWFDEHQGGMDAGARRQLSVPQEDFVKCRWRRQLATDRTIRNISTKEKRQVYQLLRNHKDSLTPHTFVPFLGTTLGQFSFFQIMARNDRSKRNPLMELCQQLDPVHEQSIDVQTQAAIKRKRK
jgi:hypothetical protein